MRDESAARIDATNDLYDAGARYRALLADHQSGDPSVTTETLDAALARAQEAQAALDVAMAAEGAAITRDALSQPA